MKKPVIVLFSILAVAAVGAVVLLPAMASGSQLTTDKDVYWSDETVTITYAPVPAHTASDSEKIIVKHVMTHGTNINLLSDKISPVNGSYVFTFIPEHTHKWHQAPASGEYSITMDGHEKIITINAHSHTDRILERIATAVEALNATMARAAIPSGASLDPTPVDQTPAYRHGYEVGFTEGQAMCADQ